MSRISRANAPMAVVAALLLVLGNGCSIKRFAINKLGDALSGTGSTFASDDDPELIKAAVPFSLKLIESMLAESPEHRGLLEAATSGFTQYAYAFVQEDADELEETNYQAAEQKRQRAKRLYLRALRYGLRGLEVEHPGFTNAFSSDPRGAVGMLEKSDVPQLYWTAASLGAAISVGKDDPSLVADIPQFEALTDRALELDESWDEGAIHSLLISYELTRQGASGDPYARARAQFDRAVELSGGHLAGPYVSLAESVCVEQQNVQEFDSLLKRALAIDVDAHPETRLVNLIMQRRARWLLSQKENLFLLPEPAAH